MQEVCLICVVILFGLGTVRSHDIKAIEIPWFIVIKRVVYMRPNALEKT